jgi:enoyl-CoA hydratase
VEYRNLIVTTEGPVRTITLNRPPMNALDEGLVAELQHAIDAATDVAAVILTGAGKAFVAGADILAMAGMDVDGARRFAEAGHCLADAIAALPAPVIAAVNGYALGGGTELALACDVIYASRAAVFGQPEVALGLIPGFGGTQRLPRRIGIGRAREWIFAGERWSAEDAFRVGLVDRLCDPAELGTKAQALAQAIAARGRLAVAAAKRAIQQGADLPLGPACALERELFAGLFATEDQKEGMAAFREKRPPRFPGR